MRALFTTQPLTGHFHPLVPLARALEAAGHEVAFATGHTFCSAVEATGFRAFCCGHDRRGVSGVALHPELAAMTADEFAAFFQVRLFAGLWAQSMALDLMPVLHQWEPSVVVRESFEFGGYVAAERAGLPHAVVEVGAYLMPLWRAWGMAEQLGRTRQAFDLAPDPDLASLSRYLHLSFVPPSYQDPTSPLPATAHAFRHVSFDQSGDEALPPWIDDLGGRPTVYATLGTAFNRRVDILKMIVDALRDEPINLILTVGREQDPAVLGPQPANVHIERYIPQTLLLPYCDLVLSHGGWNTVLGALSQGVPLVCVPISADQPANAERCVALGVGRCIPPGTVTLEAIRDAVRSVLATASYRANAGRIRAEMEALPDIASAVRLLERLAVEREPLTGDSASQRPAEAKGSHLGR